jgi:hypothetical protein
VDDIAEETVVAEIASWPWLDAGGHLRFQEYYVQSYPLDALQRVINHERARHGQPAADRPLRTGDAFWIRCEGRAGENVVSSEFDGSVFDITAAAREQAKIALYGAVARKLNPVEASRRVEASEEPDRFRKIAAAREQQRPSDPAATAKPEI